MARWKIGLLSATMVALVAPIVLLGGGPARAASTNQAAGTGTATGTLTLTGTPVVTVPVTLTLTPVVTVAVTLTGTPAATGTATTTGTPVATGTATAVATTGTAVATTTGTAVATTTGTAVATGTATGVTTAAYPMLVSRFTATRHTGTVAFRWHMLMQTGVKGFRLYAGSHRLTARMIRPHTSATYHAHVAWSGKGPFTLRVYYPGWTQVVKASK